MPSAGPTIRVDTPVLIVGGGAGAVVVAKVVAGSGLPCLLVGHHVVGGDAPIEIDDETVTVLAHHGLLDILRPYLTVAEPPTISPRVFEEVIKHHCVADLNVTVYDEVEVVERVVVGPGLRGVLKSGRSRWALSAEQFVDADLLPLPLCAAIRAAGSAALDAVEHAGAE